MGFHRFFAVSVAVLLAAGCGPHYPVTATWRTELQTGAPIEEYRLIRVTPEGKAEFHNREAGEEPTTVFPYFQVGVGESWGLERQARRRTVWQFTVERADPAKQEATVVIDRTEY